MAKVAEEYGDVCITGMNCVEVKQRVNCVRAKRSGNSDFFRIIEQPLLAHLTPEDNRNYLQFNILRSLEGELVRITGWANPDLMNYLKYPQTDVYIDGTFKCVPHPYYQCVIIMVYDIPLNYYIPVFYILTTHKTQWTYWTILNEVLISTEFKFNPARIHCDYELALINAIKEQFKEDTNVIGCYFHFKQAVLKKMKEIGIPKEQRKIAMNKGAMDILTIIPHEEIEKKGIAFVQSHFTNSPLWDKFWKYFRNTWLKRYKYEDWNIYGLEDVQNRTNNALERFNRTLNDQFPNAHPNLLNFSETVKKQSQEHFKTINLIRLGKEKTPKHDIGVVREIPVEYINFQYKEPNMLLQNV